MCSMAPRKPLAQCAETCDSCPAEYAIARLTGDKQAGSITHRKPLQCPSERIEPAANKRGPGDLRLVRLSKKLLSFHSERRAPASKSRTSSHLPLETPTYAPAQLAVPPNCRVAYRKFQVNPPPPVCGGIYSLMGISGVDRSATQTDEKGEPN